MGYSLTNSLFTIVLIVSLANGSPQNNQTHQERRVGSLPASTFAFFMVILANLIVFIMLHIYYFCCRQKTQVDNWCEFLCERIHVYRPILTHVLDVASDASVILLWLTTPDTTANVDLRFLSYASIFIILLYRTISSILIFNDPINKHGRRFWKAFLQFFDFLILFECLKGYKRPVVGSLKRKKKKSSSTTTTTQLIRMMEACLQAAPQLLFQSYVVSNSNVLSLTPFEIAFLSVSIALSLWSIVSTIVLRDKYAFLAHPDQKPNKKCPPSKLFSARFVFRVAEIVCRYAVFLLIWDTFPRGGTILMMYFLLEAAVFFVVWHCTTRQSHVSNLLGKRYERANFLMMISVIPTLALDNTGLSSRDTLLDKVFFVRVSENVVWTAIVLVYHVITTFEWSSRVTIFTILVVSGLIVMVLGFFYLQQFVTPVETVLDQVFALNEDDEFESGAPEIVVKVNPKAIRRFIQTMVENFDSDIYEDFWLDHVVFTLETEYIIQFRLDGWENFVLSKNDLSQKYPEVDHQLPLAFKFVGGFDSDVMGDAVVIADSIHNEEWIVSVENWKRIKPVSTVKVKSNY